MDVTLTHQDDVQATRRRGEMGTFLVLAMESSRPLAAAAAFALSGQDEVQIGRGRERAWMLTGASGARTALLTLPDGWASTRHVRLVREGRSWTLEDRGSKNGTYLNHERVVRASLADGDLLEVGSTYFYLRRAPAWIYEEPSGELPEGLRTLSPSLAATLDDLRRVAGSRVPIILLGETGTGKEVVARAVHQLSGRTGELCAVNCGALSGTIVESELYGHRKGAFSGAEHHHMGLVRTADRGTLFLDEVAELPLATQVKLLRVLQEQEVLPVGETHPVPVDIRPVTATLQDLPALVDSGHFRRDLYARLAGFSLRLPGLRERREDLGLLVRALLTKIAGSAAAEVRFKRAAARALFAYPWPANIRELEQTLGAAVALAGRGEISVEHLPAALRDPSSCPPGGAEQIRDDDELELRRRLSAALEKHQGNVSAVARELDKARVQIRRWCKRLDLDPEDFRRGGSGHAP